jgi:integrase
MHTMPRPRPPHLHREVTRHGKSVWYVRVGKGPRIRLHAEYGSPEFSAEYQAALEGRALPTKAKEEAAGSLAWLIARYRESSAWSPGLSATTRALRDLTFRQVLATAGSIPITRITPSVIIEGYDRRVATPSRAKHFLDTMRGLFKWATKAKLVKADPTISVEPIAAPKTDGFIPWTEEHVAAYEACWPIGTRQRVWLDVMLYTGLRRGDAIRFGRQHIRDGIGRITTEKTNVAVTLPIIKALADTIAAGPCGDLAFIAGERGRPFSKVSFTNAFRKACRKAGVPGSAHGVRKIAATRAANAGATVAQLEAIFGWTGGGRMASLYTRSADRERLARSAMHLLANEKPTSIPAPHDRVREPSNKSK